MARRGLSRFEWACLAVVALAFVYRAYRVFHPYVIWDSAWYLMLSRSFAERGDFWIRWTDPPEFSGYWPPLYPILASPIVKLLGPSYASLVVAASTMTALLCAATLFTTWDLFGRARGFAAMAIVAASPAFLTSDTSGMSESALALMIVLALWAFLKSLDRPAFLPLAGLFGLLAYFGKPNLGLPLVGAALVPLVAWRVYARGWRRVARDPLDLSVGAAGVVALVALGVTRSGKLGGLGVGLIEPLRRAVDFPLYVPFLLFKFVFACAFLLMVTLPFSLRARRAFRWPVPERDGYLALFVLLTLMATALFTTSFLITEKRGPLEFHNVGAAFAQGVGPGFVELTATIALLVDFDNIRYMTPAIVPFMWLLLPHFELDDTPALASATAPEGASVRRRHWVWFSAAVGAFVVVLLLNPLAGVGTIWRFELLCILASVALLLALVARNTQYGTTTRTSAKGLASIRFVPKKAEPAKWGLVLGLAIFFVFTAYQFSAWFLVAGIALAIASTANDPRARVVALALLMIPSAYPGYVTPYPVEKAAAAVRDHVPPGSLVGTMEPVPYLAAVFPSDRQLRLIDHARPLTDYNALIFTNREALRDAPANFTLVARWNITFEFFPTTWIRLQIEHGLFSQSFEFPEQPGLALYVRDKS